MIKKLINKYEQLPIQMKASLWFLISATFQRGFSIITAPIFTRILSTAEYGEYNVFNSWLSIISIIVTLNLFYGVYMQGLVKFEDDKNNLISALEGLTLLLITIWLIIYFIFRKFWNNLFSLSTVNMILMFATIWITAIYNFWAGAERSDYRYQKLVFLTMFATVVKPIIAIILIYVMDNNVTARIISNVSVDIALYLPFFFKQIKISNTLYSKKYWVHALSFNIPLIPHYLSQIVLNGSDRIMINNLIGASEAGIYSLAYSVSTLMSLFNTALLQTLEPWLYKKIKNGESDSIKNVAYPIFIFVAIMNVLLISFGPEVVQIFAPSEYNDAINLIPPIAMSVYFIFIYSFFASFEFYFQKTTFITLATMIGAVLNIVLNYIFINIYGYSAASYTTLVCYIIFAVMHYLFMKKVCKLYLPNTKIYDVKIIILISIGFMFVGWFFSKLYSFTLARYLCICAVFVFVLLNYKKIIELYNTLKKKEG